MADKEMIEEKIGEALGLEKAAQKAVEELDSRGLVKPEHMKKLSKMKEEASTQEQRMEELVQQLTESDELDSEKIESTAEETAEKCSKIMETYLGEGGEVTHYEVLASVARDVTNKKFGTTVKAILKEEQGHLQLCTKLAKSNAAAE